MLKTKLVVVSAHWRIPLIVSMLTWKSLSLSVHPRKHFLPKTSFGAPKASVSLLLRSVDSSSLCCYRLSPLCAAHAHTHSQPHTFTHIQTHTQAVLAGNSCRQGDITACANLGRKAVSELLLSCKGAAAGATSDEDRERWALIGTVAALSWHICSSVHCSCVLRCCPILQGNGCRTRLCGGL